MTSQVLSLHTHSQGLCYTGCDKYESALILTKDESPQIYELKIWFMLLSTCGYNLLNLNSEQSSSPESSLISLPSALEYK